MRIGACPDPYRGENHEPDDISVGKGDAVTLRMTSDNPTEEVHLAGCDLEEVSPGEETALWFEAELTGRFEIEDHQTGTVPGLLIAQPH